MNVPMLVSGRSKSFTKAFDQGSYDSLDVTDLTRIRLVPQKTWSNLWAYYCFRAVGLGGKTPLFSIAKVDHADIAAGQWLACFARSNDSDLWTQFDNVAIGDDDITFYHNTPLPSGPLYIAHFPAYPFSRVQRKLYEWAATGLISDTPSTTNYILGYSTVRSNGDDRTSPILPFYGFKLTNFNVATKNKAVLTACNHPSETTGPYALEGAVEWLLAGSAQAHFLLDNFEFYVYPCVNPQGVYGGYFRSCPEDPTKDHNRQWAAGGLEDVDAFKTAIAADTGGHVEVGIDFHGDIGNDSAYVTCNDDTDALHIVFASKLAVLDATVDLRELSVSGQLHKLFYDSYTPQLAMALEHGDVSTRGISDWKTYGARSMQVLAAMLAEGRFNHGPGVGSRDFNGSTDRIDWSSIWNPTGQPVTISLWLLADRVAASQHFLNVHDAGDLVNGMVIYGVSSGRLSFTRHGAADVFRGSAAAAQVIGSWQHLLSTHNGGPITTYADIHLYLNGVEVAYDGVQVGVAPETSHAGSWSLGGRIFDNARCFDGKIAQVRVFNRVLSAAEIALESAGILTTVADLKFWFKGNTDDLHDIVTDTEGSLDGTTQVTGVGTGPTIIYP
jgi:hypothetical protein